MEKKNKSAADSENEALKPGFLKLVLSTMAAAIGVQSRKNLETDFQQSSPFPFIAAGIIFTVLFVLALVGIASVVLKRLT